MIIFKTITETFFSNYRGFVQFCMNTLSNQPIIFCGTGFSNLTALILKLWHPYLLFIDPALLLKSSPCSPPQSFILVPSDLHSSPADSRHGLL